VKLLSGMATDVTIGLTSKPGEVSAFACD
jgi:hypothetical protein